MSRIAQAGTILSSLKRVERRVVGLLCWEHRTEGCPDESFILPCCGRSRWGQERTMSLPEDASEAVPSCTASTPGACRPVDDGR